MMPPLPSGSLLYALMMIVGIGLGAVYWVRASRTDGRLPILYFCCLVGAFLGAKLAFLFAEGWLHFHNSNRWLVWLSGKSIMGALPGGWIGVELAKKALGYTKTTGDRFAMLLPLPLILGRIGCMSAGCCGGIVCTFGKWPAVQVELGFQVAALLALWVMRRKQWCEGQHFHFYLIGYGLFRFAHEFMRDTPKPFAGLSGYQIIALATAVAAVIAARRRDRAISDR